MLKKCGIENQTIIVLMLALKDKPQKMEQVINYLAEQEKNNTIDSDRIERETMRIAREQQEKQ